MRLRSRASSRSQRLWEALQIVERFGVPVGSLVDWTRIVSPAATPEQRFEIARDLKEAIKARFEPETWQRVAQPIFDRLRAAPARRARRPRHAPAAASPGWSSSTSTS